MTVERYPGDPTVIVVNGDPVMSQALTLLLQTANYDVRSVPRSSLEDSADISGVFEGVQLAILTPGMAVVYHERALALLRNVLSTTSIPSLQLGASPEGARTTADYLVPWPCRIEDLQRQIEAALLAGGALGRAAAGEVQERGED
ncbi:MAG: hypothetical protein H0V53_03935 [Rubrobacter sp.]|nr:hypothetical protein [Rubrobacter sp.]